MVGKAPHHLRWEQRSAEKQKMRGKDRPVVSQIGPTLPIASEPRVDPDPASLSLPGQALAGWHVRNANPAATCEVRLVFGIEQVLDSDFERTELIDGEASKETEDDVTIARLFVV